jgi:hypothetical protein
MATKIVVKLQEWSVAAFGERYGNMRKNALQICLILKRKFKGERYRNDSPLWIQSSQH